MIIDENARSLIDLALMSVLILLGLVSIYMAGIKYSFKGKRGLYWFGVFCLCYSITIIDSCIDQLMTTGSKIINIVSILACISLLIYIAKGVKDGQPKPAERP